MLLVVAGQKADAHMVSEAAGAMPRATVRAYPDADHDVHAQHPDEVAADLLALAAAAEAAPDGRAS